MHSFVHLQALHENSVCPSDRDINWRPPVQGKSSPVLVKEPYSNLKWLLVGLLPATQNLQCALSVCPPRRLRCNGRKLNF